MENKWNNTHISYMLEHQLGLLLKLLKLFDAQKLFKDTRRALRAASHDGRRSRGC